MPLPRLVGMIHLRALPGSPGFDGDLDSVIAAARADASTLAEAGFDGLMVENFGDAPFFADDVPKATIAAMTTTVNAIYDEARIPVGVNVLRNDALGALSIAAATEASFIRVNVLSGTMFTDQGPIVGRAAEVARLRVTLCPDVAVMADVFVKHATPPQGLTLEDATHDLLERGGADAVIVSGAGTGSPADVEQLSLVSGLSKLPVYLGSGVTPANAPTMLSIANGAIVGTSLKPGGDIDAPVDLDLALALIAAVPSNS